MPPGTGWRLSWIAVLFAFAAVLLIRNLREAGMEVAVNWDALPFLLVAGLASHVSASRTAQAGSIWERAVRYSFVFAGCLAFGSTVGALVVIIGTVVSIWVGVVVRNRPFTVSRLFDAARSLVALLLGGIVAGRAADEALTSIDALREHAIVPFLLTFVAVEAVCLVTLYVPDLVLLLRRPRGGRSLEKFRGRLVLSIGRDVLSIAIGFVGGVILDVVGIQLRYWIACAIGYVVVLATTRMLDLNVRLSQRNVELARAMRELRTMNAIGQSLTSSLDLDQLTADLGEHLARIGPADSVLIALLDDDLQRIRVIFQQQGGIRQPNRQEAMPAGYRVAGSRLAIDSPAAPPGFGVDSILARVIRAGTAVVGADTESFPLVRPDGTTLPAGRAGVRHFASAVGVPLRSGGDMIGVLVLKSYRAGAFREAEIDLLTAIANQAAATIRNADNLHQERESARARQDFLTVVSHELRTPMTTISGYSQLLARRVDKDFPPGASDGDGAQRPLSAIGKRYREIAGTVEAQSRHLGQLVDDLVTLSELGRGRLSADHVPVDLVAQARVTISRLLTDASVNGQVVLLGDESAVVRGDPRRLQQMLMHLIRNSLASSPPDRPVRVSLCRQGDEVELQVSDDGPGIPEEMLPTLFQPFVRRVGPDGHIQKGMGLGLSLTREIVVAHQGHMSIRTRVGEGTTMLVSFPAEPAQTVDGWPPDQ